MNKPGVHKFSKNVGTI